MKYQTVNSNKLYYESPFFQVFEIEHENCIAAGSLPKESVSNSIQHFYEEEIIETNTINW